MRTTLTWAVMLVCLVVPVICHGFSGSVTQDTTWTTDMWITGDVEVINGATLTIEPDLTITFVGDWALLTDYWSNSAIVAHRSLFTSMNETPGAWASIGLQGMGASVIQDCEIRYANCGVMCWYAPEAVVSGCHLHHNVTGLYSSDGILFNEAVTREGQARQTFGGNVIEWNEVGIRTDWGFGGVFEDNIVRHNSEAGMRFGDYCHAALYRNVIVANGIGIHFRWQGLGAMDPTIGGSPGNANEIHSNATYDLHLEAGSYGVPNDITAQYNYWGEETTQEMNAEGYPSDIEAIFDCWEDPLAGCVDYQNWMQSTDPVADDPVTPPAHAQLRAAPNPFEDTVLLTYSGAGRSHSRIRVYDVTGCLVRAYGIDSPVGEITWDGRDDRGRRVAPGTYYIQMPAGFGYRTARVVMER